MCRFDFPHIDEVKTIETEATYARGTLPHDSVICTSPPSPRGYETFTPASFSVYSRLEKSFLIQDAEFTFYDAPVDLQISPNSAAEMAGTELIITSSGLRGLPALGTTIETCKCILTPREEGLDKFVLIARYDTTGDQTQLVCTTPKELPVATYDVSISLNSYDNHKVSGERGFFRVLPAPNVMSVTPRIVTNSTETIMLEGSNLIPNNSVESIGTGCCVFDNGEVTSAYAFGATSVNCKLPHSWAAVNFAFTSGVTFTFDCSMPQGTQQLAADRSFPLIHLAAPRQIHASPVFGPLHDRTTVVLSGTEIGASIVNSKLQSELGIGAVRCYFGDVEVLATIINSNTAACVSPAFVQSNAAANTSATEGAYSVTLKVSIDGGYSKYTTAQKYFTFVPSPIIESVLPNIAIEGKKLPLIFRGSGFSPRDSMLHKSITGPSSHQGSCRVGTLSAPLLVLSDTTAMCVSCRLHLWDRGVRNPGISLWDYL